ncbi:MAG: YlmC/YmxH family sporulation protein [Oscillospiraceae bacterium]|nr:YlmC/YmxH family sporulation protein [Oscillospiraceae bacterium]
MNCKVSDLKYKNVINIVDGSMIGSVNDIEIDTCDAKITAIIIYGKFRCFGLLGREEDIVIPWCDIEIIGKDAVLVRYKKIDDKKPRMFGFLPQFFK